MSITCIYVVASNVDTALVPYKGFSEMVRDHGNPRIAVVLFQDGYRFIILYALSRWRL